MAAPNKSTYTKKYMIKEGLPIYVRHAKKCSYGGTRNLNSIKYIVVHYTSGSSDSSANEATYFATGNTRSAGAHFFVDKQGIIFKTVNMKEIAYSVGGLYTLSNGAGRYYRKCTNTNSISIELCSYVKGMPVKAQMQAVACLIKYIQRKCPNAKTIIRHWDVNGKCCPAPMAGKSSINWKTFKKKMKVAGVKAKWA